MLTHTQLMLAVIWPSQGQMLDSVTVLACAHFGCDQLNMLNEQEHY